jgi:hypothetical protein
MNQKLIDLIEEYNPTNGSITGATRLYQDLNIYGDDASDLLSKYSEAFKVELKDFKFDTYFPNEGDSILPRIIRMILMKPPQTYKELTVTKLNEGIDTGVLK